eukprot:Blabericola_migrator_1__3433@NODE_200_length_11466_cov_45_966751_g172_i0_p10_GENE_NODE_200_length_11466_cov_45_966751_g172_i0NODE_200_length_11466_cov_45_966751_g172_i0_p10_ORF_typecomplete_len113_score20_47_NODE_200_length_11466_cov_45_966751_g172_i020432381
MHSPALTPDALSQVVLLKPSKGRPVDDAPLMVPGWFLNGAILLSMVSGIAAIMSQKAMNRVRYWRCDNFMLPECAISYFASPLWQIVLGAIGGKHWETTQSNGLKSSRCVTQ